jgi:hypothetical protein
MSLTDKNKWTLTRKFTDQQFQRMENKEEEIMMMMERDENKLQSRDKIYEQHQTDRERYNSQEVQAFRSQRLYRKEYSGQYMELTKGKSTCFQHHALTPRR